MQFQFEVAPPRASLPAAAAPPASPPVDVADVLRQTLEVQREQLNALRFLASVHDAGPRWRAFLGRHREEFPALGSACKAAVPAIERAYLNLINELGEWLGDPENALDTDFALNEFLDRYGVRLGQLSTLLGLISPLADAARADEG